MKQSEKQAKQAYSRYVRLKGCIETTGSEDYGQCFTCGKIVPYEQSQAGHFISGRQNSLFFEPNNCHLQCSECNITKGGNLKVYREKMVRLYGIEEVERLEALRHIPMKITEEEFKEFRCKFESKFKSLQY